MCLGTLVNHIHEIASTEEAMLNLFGPLSACNILNANYNCDRYKSSSVPLKKTLFQGKKCPLSTRFLKMIHPYFDKSINNLKYRQTYIISWE